MEETWYHHCRNGSPRPAQIMRANLDICGTSQVLVLGWSKTRAREKQWSIHSARGLVKTHKGLNPNQKTSGDVSSQIKKGPFRSKYWFGKGITCSVVSSVCSISYPFKRVTKPSVSNAETPRPPLKSVDYCITQCLCLFWWKREKTEVGTLNIKRKKTNPENKT